MLSTTRIHPQNPFSSPPSFSLQIPTHNHNHNHKNVSFRIRYLTTAAAEEKEEERQVQVQVQLPVVVKQRNNVSRFFWDGNRLQLLSSSSSSAAAATPPTPIPIRTHLLKLTTVVRCAVTDFFLPTHVHPNYVHYVKWKFFHRLFSSALQVLATQAMLRAIGINSFSSAAGLNWVLKDGLGRLSRCIYTATVASAFDTNLKRVRLSTSLLFSLGIGLELLTPVFPRSFLLLASLANIAKQISLACHLATYPAVHRSFAIVDNLGEVSAKSQIQTVCFDNLGLLLAALLNLLCKNNHRLQAGLPFFVYPFFSVMDIFGIYQALKHVHLQTLTKDRLEIIIHTWIQFRYVPTPAEVSKQEDINLFGNTGTKTWSIRIGCVDVKKQLPLLTFLTMKTLTSKDFYFICPETCLGLTRRTQRGILVSLREGACTMEAIAGLLQACRLREALLKKSLEWDNFIEAGAASNALADEWFKVTQESRCRSEAELYELYEQMKQRGWIVDNILLSTREQTRYSFADDGDG